MGRLSQMKQRRVRRVDLLCLLMVWMAMLPITTASAGSRGYVAVMMSIGEKSFFDSEVYKKNLSGEFSLNRKIEDCWNQQATGGARVAWTIRKKIPDGLTVEMARATWSGSLSAASAMQRILSKSIAPDGYNEVDGLFIVSAGDGKITIMALGSRAPLGEKNPSKKVTIPWNEKDPRTGAAAFDLALCSVSSPLGVGFGP